MTLISLIPLFPLIGFLINGLGFGKISKTLVPIIGTGASLLSFGCVLAAYLQFDGTPVFKASPGEWFFLGKLTYYNGTIVSGSGAGGVSLKFAFNMTQPTTTTTTADYLFKLVNTKNSGTKEESADYVYLPTLGVPFSTTVGGRKFKLDLRFGETTADGFGNVSEFHIYEGKSATGSLYGRITEVP